MFLIVKFGFFLLGVITRYLFKNVDSSRYMNLGPDEVRPVVVRPKKNVVEHELVLSWTTYGKFRFDREKGFEKFLKAVGVVTEIQTGHREFDSSLFVTSDYLTLNRSLRTDTSLQDLILYFFRLPGFSSIRVERNTIILRGKIDFDSLENREKAKLLRQKLSQLFVDRPFLDQSPYFWRVLSIEVIVYGIAGMSLSRFINLYFQGTDVINVAHFVLVSLLASLVLFVFLLMLMRFLLDGSSQGRGVFFEGSVILFLTLPFGASELVLVTNHLTDAREPVVYQSVVSWVGTYTPRGRRGRRGMRRTVLRFESVNPADAIGVKLQGDKLKLSPFDSKGYFVGQRIGLRVRRGGLGVAVLEDVLIDPPL